MQHALDEQQAHVYSIALTAIAKEPDQTEWEIKEVVEKLAPLFAPTLADDQYTPIVRQLISALNVRVDRGVAITEQGHEPWLEKHRHDISWHRWTAYKQLLLAKNYPPRVVDTMDQVTNDIVDHLGNPRLPGPWRRRGLVIGDVQSGKTASYIGVIDKAIDAGFRLVIVLAGSTESLRQQTQERLDEGVIGRSTRDGNQTGSASTVGPYGIGQFNAELPTVQSMTTVLKDFTKLVKRNTNIHIGQGTEGSTFIVVLKKNGKVLEAVYDWLERQQITGNQLTAPLLVLDDESDYASVNTRATEDENPTAINGKIRDILGLFERSSYLAFTATPFANIFIDSDVSDDLFPRDYVYALEAPSNYVGARAFFGTSYEPASKALLKPTDAEAYFPSKHNKRLRVNGIPRSLQEAIEAFFIANAVRDIRGHSSDARSMLINVTRFKDVQATVSEIVSDYVTELRNAVQFHSLSYANGTPNSSIENLEKTYFKVYGDLAETVDESWKAVLGRLPSAVTGIAVQTFNSDSDKKLEEQNLSWDRPPRLIAVGGDVLSRGLTLEGLTVSYFYRRAAAFDTLMQMARWFGYRPGYDDLCRLWIDETIAAQYRFIDEAISELRDDLRYMKAQRLTPSDFGLAVKKHPESLLVTARNKMRSAEDHKKVVSLVGRRIESTKLSSEPDAIGANMAAFRQLVMALDESTPRYMDLVEWRDVDKSLSSAFLTSFTGAKTDPIWFADNLAKFVSASRGPLLSKWDVAVVRGSQNHDWSTSGIEGLEIPVPRRNVVVSPNGELAVAGKSSRLAGPHDLARFLSDEERAQAEANYRRSHEQDEETNVGEAAFYPVLKNPVLLLYPLVASFADAEVDQTTLKVQASVDSQRSKGNLLIAAKLAIPGERASASKTGDIEYVINKVATRTWFADFDETELSDDYDG